jgi:protein translocase SecG subunit
MAFVIGLLTLIMVLDCLVLIFLVLIQLPKKEAGAGLAFGGAATDALFGAGKGTALTVITKYAATTFFVLAIILSIMQSRHYHRTSSEFQRRLEQPARPPAGAVAPTPAPSTAPAAPAAKPAVPLTSTNLLSAPQAEETKPPTTPTNPAAAPAPQK